MYYDGPFLILTLQRISNLIKMATRKNFSFRYEWSERIAHLSEKTQYEILVGTVAYAKTGEFPTGASAEARAAFDEHILPDFLKRAKAAEYRARAKARKAAAQTQTVENNKSAEPHTAPAKEDAAPQSAEELDAAPAPIPLSRAERRRRARELEKQNKRRYGQNFPQTSSRFRYS